MTPKLLVHCCCVHCSAYTLNYWREQGFGVTAFWYNPNIHPFLEHQRRLEALKSLVAREGISVELEPGYDLDKYFVAAAGKNENRCRECYRLRLGKVASYAAEHGFDAFTSSLLISPQQKHDQIIEIARSVELISGVVFEYADLRKRYSDSRRLTKPLDLYRQQYCGCLYSEWERYRDESTTPKGIEV
ncbi:hypothetical protein Dform_00950 [Dehalogenimonas formicexedens]|uniref:Epoxyqueuosine reductase QueH n=1 Tax=Dehalogenimonas formicexedens TaxID=1839801 RepID=A0A1P8F737_9CHLR|nr:epoxyqueuosine reductase QueH [Dehalogenimonas formicexedens]APV44291.1 hypothetical protein Dform_00950 [Dehalogenimonas formicexedens]